ncbi:MAG: LysM peptidoglycan-binding domain-containing protein [Bacteroidota bacterium]
MSFVSSGQTKSTDIKTINGKKYYIHKVEKGQSLYAIAKVYNMDVNSILAENDEAIDGLQTGQELKIPVESLMPKQTAAIDTNKYIYHKIAKGETVYAITKKYSIDEKKLTSYNPTINSGLKEGNYLIVGEKKKNTGFGKSNPSASGTFDSYTVLTGETLYGISKKLNVSQDDLLKWNPELKDGAKQGQVLKIASGKPVSIPTATVNGYTKDASVIDTALLHKPKKTAYTIGLFLPFKLAESEGINIDDLARAKASFPATQSLALDFYAGFKKAVDSLNSKDFEVSIRLFDTDDRDSAKIESICKTIDFKNLDAIFGPLYAGVFKIVSRYAKAATIPIVSPVIQQNKILFDNPLSSKVTPSVYTLIEGLADYSLDSLSAANIIIVNTTAKDQAYIKTFKTRYNESLIKHNRTLKDSVVEVKGIAGVKNAYVYSKKNVIVLLTNNQVYLQDFITQLYVFSDKKDIVLMGFNSVSNIDNLDQDYLNGLQFHFASADEVDFKDSIVRHIAKPYQEYYGADPSESYFKAFDVATYYLSHLKTVGPDFFLNLDKYNWNGVTLGFKFFRPDIETGFENRSLYIYRYSNYQLQRSGWK